MVTLERPETATARAVALTVSARQLSLALGRALAPWRIEWTAAIVLRVMASWESPQPISVLARDASVQAQTATEVLDHLERRDVIVRERSLTDRRIVNVSLTVSGRELAAVICPVVDRTAATFFAGRGAE